jgi:hypothetical protein
LNEVTEKRHLRRGVQAHRELAEVFQQCSAAEGQEGIFDDELLQCIGTGDLVTGLAEALINATAAGGTSQEAQRIIEAVVEPLGIILQLAFDAGAGVAGFSFDLCLGDFPGEDIVSPIPGDEIALCSDLPLKEDAEWSLIAFNLEIPAGYSRCSVHRFYG